MASFKYYDGTEWVELLKSSDISAWAKASSKPSYTASEVGAVPTSRKVNGHALTGDISVTASDVGLGNVLNKAITVTSTSVSDGTNTFNKYTHPTKTAVAAAAKKVGYDSYGHVVLGDALTAADVGARSSSWMPTAAQVGALPTGTTLDNIADGSTRKLANYLPLAGGTVTGNLTITGNLTVGPESNVTVGYLFVSDVLIQKSDIGLAILQGSSVAYLPHNSTGALATQAYVEGKGYTSNTGTVTSVRVQAGTGLASSQNTAQTGSLDTTISIASGYKLPTTTEWNNKSSVSGVNDGTNWTSITIDGTTKNIPSGGSGGGITEISTQYIRIWDLEPGIYLLTYNGTKYLYYSGASGTNTHTVKGGSGKVILTVDNYNTTKVWYYDSVNSTLDLTRYTRFYGKTTSSSGITSSILLVPETIYKHDVLFTLSGYGSFAFTYYNSSSSAALPVALAEMLKGQVLANLVYTDGSGLCIFGDYTSSRIDTTMYFTLYNKSNGNVITYTANQVLTINSDTATAL